MSRMECVACGLAPCDLPDGVPPEVVFERVNGQWWCEGCSTAATTCVGCPGCLTGGRCIDDPDESDDYEEVDLVDLLTRGEGT